MARCEVRYTGRWPAFSVVCVALTALLGTYSLSVRGTLAVESLVQTSGELVGVAVAPDGTGYVSDVRRGEILKVDTTGSVTIVAAGLRRPSGLVLAGPDLLVAEEGTGRVLRLTPTGGVTVFAKGMRTPRGLALDHDGTLYITAHRLLGPDGSDPDEAKVIIRRDPSTGALSVIATDVHQLEALALDGTALFATAGWIEGLPQAQGVIARYSLLPDGRLYVADGHSGRLVRFPAPPPPKLAQLPAFTNASPLAISGTAVPSARIDVFVNDAAAAITGTSDKTGAFTLQVPLELNAKNVLEVFATAHLGDGLTSAPARVSIAHDGQPPTINFVAPPVNAFLRQTVTVQAQASGGADSPVM